jgi:hypothetical protein
MRARDHAARAGRLPLVFASIGAAAAVVAGVVVGEGWIIGLVAGLGPLRAFLVVVAVSCAGSCLIAFAFDEGEAKRGALPVVARIRRWIADKRAGVEKRTAALANMSAVLAFVLLSVTVGPFLTAVAVKLRGGESRADYALCVIASVIFSAVWVSIYWGGVTAVRQVFWG